LTSRGLIALLRIGNEPIPSGFVMPTPLGEAAQTRNPVLSDLCREHRAKPVPPKSDSLMLISIPRSASRSSTLRGDGGYRTYIITTRRITSGELLKYRNGLLIAWL
jgi:hypothetical protein